MKKYSVEESMSIIKRGTIDLVSEEELVKKLKKKKPLRIKLGLDPTAPDLHFGHAVVLNKLREFQNLGHKVVLIIGDFTAKIGDPSGRSKLRPPLSASDIKSNLKTYIEQASKVLNMNDVELCYNSKWLSNMNFEEIIKLCTQSTVARMLERDDFKKRYAEGNPISIHEFLYPLMQGDDSVAIQADVELGGTDQIFNLLMGRDLQRASDQEPQVVLTMPLLVGTDGVQKMSKSYGNYIGITETPNDMYGKIMSISDELMWDYYKLLSEKSIEEIKAMEGSVVNGELHPMKAKEDLAIEIVTRFHDESSAISAKGNFKQVFSKRENPDDMELIKTQEVNLVNILNDNNLVSSKTDARRLIKQGAVQIDGNKISDIDYVFEGKKEHIIKCGKRRFAKIKII